VWIKDDLTNELTGKTITDKIQEKLSTPIPTTTTILLPTNTSLNILKIKA